MDENIFKRYLTGDCTEYEKSLVEHWFNSYKESNPEATIDELEALVQSLDKKLLPSEKTKIFRLKILTYAASVAILLLGGFFLFWNFVDTTKDDEDIQAPQYSNAVVILEDETTFSLDNLMVGDTIQAVGFKITKDRNGELQYIYNDWDSDVLVFNTLRTETGGIASVQLSDGTLVWLNAKSELKYPVVFQGDLREVELIGEAYFEVAKNKGIPFLVKGDNQTVEVLGTKFNANFTSENEVALIEGSVAVSNEGLLFKAPNAPSYRVVMQENQMFDGKNLYEVRDIEKYIDWKMGYFDLNDMPLERLVVKLADWYGVDVSLDHKDASRKLFGKISRERSLKDVLDLVNQVVPIEYEIKNKTLKIMETNN